MREPPFVTVIMPIRNEARAIANALWRILAQDYPADRMEILIADGMSTDSTRQIVQQFILRHSPLPPGEGQAEGNHPPSNFQLLDNPGRIVPTGMNLALRQAKGEIILRVDGHTVIAPDYVRQCVDTLRRTGAGNVGGRMVAVGVNAFGKAAALASSSPFGVGGSRFHFSEEEEWVDTVYMGAWRRRVFEEIGLFDEELIRNQDDEFNYRLRAKGGRILLCPEIKSEYTARGSVPSLWRQYFQYGFWKVRVLQKHPLQMSPRQFVPPLFVFSLLVSFLLLLSSFILQSPFSNLYSPSSILYLSALIPLLYILVNLSASFIASAKKGWKYFPLLPVIFAILHLSYGLGFLVGLGRFSNRWNDRVGKVPAFDQ